MLKEFNIQYCLVGHSERRTLFNETDQDVGVKIKLLQDNNIIPVVITIRIMHSRSALVKLSIKEITMN